MCVWGRGGQRGERQGGSSAAWDVYRGQGPEGLRVSISWGSCVRWLRISFSQQGCSQPASQWNPYRSKPLQAYTASTSLLGLHRYAYKVILALIATTAHGFENNASPKAVISGDDFHPCFQPVLPQCHLNFVLQNYTQLPINETLPYIYAACSIVRGL